MMQLIEQVLEHDAENESVRQMSEAEFVVAMLGVVSVVIMLRWLWTV